VYFVLSMLIFGLTHFPDGCYGCVYDDDDDDNGLTISVVRWYSGVCGGTVG